MRAMAMTLLRLLFMNIFCRFPAWNGVLLLLFFIGPAHADVWGYIDERGTAHFAAQALDERYELFYRGGEVFDTGEAQGVAPLASGQPTPGVPSGLVTYFEVSPSYKAVRHLLSEAAQTHGIDVELLQALIATESGFDASAVSPKGAVGLMQLMPATAGRYGVVADARASVEKKLTDPGTNVRAGARYLRDLLSRFSGQLDLALAAYNAGEGAVQRAGNRVPDYRETRQYVSTVTQLYRLLKPPAAVTRQRAIERVRMTLPAGRANMTSPAFAAAGPLAGPDETLPR